MILTIRSEGYSRPAAARNCDPNVMILRVCTLAGREKVLLATAATLLGLRDRMSANHGSNFSGSKLMDRMREFIPRTNNRHMY